MRLMVVTPGSSVLRKFHFSADAASFCDDAQRLIDLDVHQGNGTARILADDPNAFTFSVHGANNFPLRKEQSDLDIALQKGTAQVESRSRPVQ